MNLTWLVVVDNSKARIFTMNSKTGPIEEIKVIEHKEARLHEQKMTSDLPGKCNGKGGAGGHAYQDKVSPKDQENINFAKKIAHELDAARKNKKLKQFILVGAPGFLGNLRSNFNSQTKKLVYLELAKNWSNLNTIEIREHLSKRLLKV